MGPLQFKPSQVLKLFKTLPPHILKRIKFAKEDYFTQCWEYEGEVLNSGYTRCWYNDHRFLTHRLLYELISGKDIRNKQVDHLCENKLCCNPNHMEPVTAKVNSRRKFRRRKTVCHLVSQQNK